MGFLKLLLAWDFIGLECGADKRLMFACEQLLQSLMRVSVEKRMWPNAQESYRDGNLIADFHAKDPALNRREIRFLSNTTGTAKEIRMSVRVARQQEDKQW